MLAKQFVEKDGNLKLLLQKYADDRLAETEAIKDKFRKDMAVLDDLKKDGKLADATHREQAKKLAVDEANLINDMMVNFERAHKDEEAALRAVFDKKHLDEQIAFRKAQHAKNHKVKKDLFGDEMAEEEKKIDQKSLENFLALKKAEQEKRARQLEQEKRQVRKDLDKRLNDRIADHEDLLRKKREQAAAIANQTNEIRERLAERKKRLKDTNFQGLSEEEKQRQLAAAMSRYENLGYTYRDERQRQQKAMEKKLALRKQRLERTRRIKMMYGEE